MSRDQNWLLIIMFRFNRFNRFRFIRNYGQMMLLTGATIFGLNVYNIKKSPEWELSRGYSRTYQFTILITLKSMLYGMFYPIALSNILLDTFSEKRTQDVKQDVTRHFIPFSTYRMTKRHT